MNEHIKTILALQKSNVELKKYVFKIQTRHDELKSHLGAQIQELSRRCKAMEARIEKIVKNG
jgi:hypothetical protein